MPDYRRILQLYEEDVSQRGIADALRCSRNTVAAVVATAKDKAVTYAEMASLDDGEIRHLLFPELDDKEKDSPYVKPDFKKTHTELSRTGVTLLMLWNEYANRCRELGKIPYQYSFYCEQYRRWASATKATMHIPRTSAEIMEVDWAGDVMEYADPLTGELYPAYLFVTAMTYSAYAYVEAFAKMDLPSWVGAHIHAFAHFSGVARLLVPDNLRTGVKKPDRYEPALNAAYAAMAEHYGCAVIPARVKYPRDKPVAEGSVRHIANTIAGTLRDRSFIGIYELNGAIGEELKRLNAKPFQKRDDNRRLVFVRDEQPKLLPLPKMPFELSEPRKAKVGPNYHVQVDGCFYSVPHRYIGQSLDIRLGVRTVEVFDGAGRITTHPRMYGKKNQYSTIEEHMPREHRDYLRDWTPERFKRWAQSIGPETTKAVSAILASRKVVEQSFRSCMGLLSLAKKTGGKARLEWACAHALELSAVPSYTMVKRIWADWADEQEPVSTPSLGDRGYVRGADYFASAKEGADDR
ncbi:MAG: IS21 family transposase [Coriobacteriales bacterium]|jgi:transposase|nr:IS21 family transposase [Coriobacteriales bacterium]